jgi:two-component system sensor histidine kinase YesM
MKSYGELLGKKKTFSLRLLKRISISKKILLLYVVIILIPSCIAMYIYYEKSSSIMENEVTHTILQTIKQAEVNISFRLDNVKDISNIMFMNNTLQAYLMRSPGDDTLDSQIKDTMELKDVIYSMQNKADIHRIKVFIDNNKIHSGEQVNFFSINDISNKVWYKNIIEENGRIYWKSTYLERYINEDTSRYVISCARLLRNPTNYDNIMGILVIDVLEESFYNILSQIDLSSKGDLFIIDENGIVVSHKDKNRIGYKLLIDDEMKIVKDYDEGVYKSQVGENDKFLIYKKIELTNWKIITSIPREEVVKNTLRFNNLSTFIMITAIMIAFMFVIFLIFAFAAEEITGHIKKLVNTMEEEGIESFNNDTRNYKGDMYRLEKSVNSIIKRLKVLMEESYISKVREREAQLKALQAQINPHFLYNTLDTINWMAIRRKADDISFMLDSLAKYFRLSLNQGKDVVSISDEINLAKAYLDIQKMRFINSFEAVFDIEEEVKQYSMPKLTLQPIIENALLHGIQNKESQKGIIIIQANKVGEDIYFRVKDDGIGMSNEKVQQLLACTKENIGNSYGLYNVNQRLRLFSGESYGLIINSEEGKGTTIEIKVKQTLVIN